MHDDSDEEDVKHRTAAVYQVTQSKHKLCINHAKIIRESVQYSATRVFIKENLGRAADTMDHFFVYLGPSYETTNEQHVKLQSHEDIQEKDGHNARDPIVPVRQLQIIFNPGN